MKNNVLGIEKLKKEIVEGISSDMRIINLLNSSDTKKSSAYLNKNIFSYLNDNCNETSADTYIYFDIAENEDEYKLEFKLKSHKDINSCVLSNIDRMTTYIQENILKLYPMCKNFYINPAICRNSFLEKRMNFYLHKSEMSATHEIDGQDLIKALRKYVENH